jgi:hypothetical protein
MEGGTPPAVFAFSFEGADGFAGADFAAVSVEGGAMVAAKLPTSNFRSTEGVAPEPRSTSCVAGVKPSSEISAW